MTLIDTLNLKGNQLAAATAQEQDVALAAGAGSGKTKTLVARYLYLLDGKRPPRAVVAITFTNKAAREMRNRIRQEIQNWIAGDCPAEERAQWEEIEADIDTARIGTIHGLCEDILRAHPAEAGIDPGFQVLDEGLAAALRAQAVQDTLAWSSQQRALTPLFEIFETRDLENILGALLEKRLEANTAFAREDFDALWEKSLRGALKQFTDAAADAIGELTSLVGSGLEEDAGDKLAPQVLALVAEWSAFDMVVAGDAKQSANAEEPIVPLQSLDSASFETMIQAARHLFILRRNYCDGRSGKSNSRAKAVVKELRELYDDTLGRWLGGEEKDDSPPDVENESLTREAVPLLKILFAHARDAYQAAKNQRRELDFDDLEGGALKLLKSSSIRARWQSQIDALLVDEFQDTNERQRQIVEALAGIADGKTGRLFVVGDAKQSIYRFRGADVTVFREVNDDIRARGGLPLTLDHTYRAHNTLVNALNEILAKAMGGKSSRYAVEFSKLIAERDQPEANVTAPFIEFLYGVGEDAQASGARLLAQRLREMNEKEKIAWEQIALLFRASTGFPMYEDALEAAGIPFVTVAGKGFYERPEIRDVLNILRALADPWDDLAMAGLLRSPAFGVSDEGLYRLRWSSGNEQTASFRNAIAGNLASLSDADRRQVRRAKEIVEQFAGVVDRAPVAELLKQVLDVTYYPAILASEDAGARLQRNLDKLLSDAQASEMIRMGEFLQYVETLHDVGAREGEAPTDAGGAVRLMTVHKAKGLEFPIVVLADASRGRPSQRDAVLLSADMGLVPNPGKFESAPLMFRLSKMIDREQADAEDKRLLYVAATRSREKLIVCGNESRARQHWFGALAAAAGLDVARLDRSGKWTTLALESGIQVGAMAQAVEPTKSETKKQVERADSSSDDAVLYAPLVTLDREQTDDKRKDADGHRRRLRRVIGRRRVEGAELGTLVHVAIQRWMFPGDAGLDALLRAEALMEGLVDDDERDATIAQAKELLNRLREDARFAEIEAATERYHEIPYSQLGDREMMSGVIDLFYRAANGKWIIVDFKTDDIQDADQLIRLREQYTKQLVRYREAVRRLFGQLSETWLCFLNYGGAVRWEKVG